MICPRCAKDVPDIHTCSPSKLVRELEELAKVRTHQCAEVTSRMRVLEMHCAELRSVLMALYDMRTEETMARTRTILERTKL